MRIGTFLKSTSLVAFLACAGMPALAETPPDQLIVGVSLVNMLSLDPSAMSGRESTEVNSNIYDSLLETDPVEKGVFHPRLASSWEVNDARDTITFKLRDDVKFHSGNPLTAKDFVWSVTRAFALGIGGSNIRVFGYNEKNIAEMITAPDDHTVVVRLPKASDPDLILGVIAGSGIGMVIDSKLAMEHEKNGDFGQAWLTTNSAGSGPFKLVRWQANDTVVLQRVDDHWSGPAKMRRIIYRHMPESQSQRLALQRDDIDIAMGMSVADVKALQTDEKLATAEVPSGNVYYLAVSMKDKKFKDQRVRLALRHLIDYEGINETILPFYGKLHQRPLSPGLPGSLPDPGYKLDPAFAKEQLTAAGYPNGFKTTIRVLADSPFVNVATAIQASLAQGGITAEIITGNGDQTYGAMRDRKFEMVVGRGGDRNGSHPYTSLLSLVYNPNNTDEAKLYTLQAWRTSFQSKEINELLDAALIEPDAEKQRASYEKIQTLYEELVPSIQVISQSYDTVVYQADLKNYIAHPYQTTRYRNLEKDR